MTNLADKINPAPSALTPAQQRVLDCLKLRCDDEGFVRVRQVDIAGELNICRETVGMHINNLVKGGHIERHRRIRTGRWGETQIPDCYIVS